MATVAEDRAAGLLEAAKEKLARGAEAVKETAKVVDEKVHSHPWPIIGAAFVGGVLLGYILGRRSSD